VRFDRLFTGIGNLRKFVGQVVVPAVERNQMVYKTKKWKPPSKKEKGGKNPTGQSPRRRKACHSISTALLKSVAEIRTQSAW
jgi:hypothetical protein